MGDILMAEGVVENLERKTSSKGSEYIRVTLHDGTRVDFYSDDWKEELEENWEEYEGLIVEVFYEDRGYTFGKVIVPADSKKAGQLLEKKVGDDFEGLSEEEKEDLLQEVEKIFDRDRGNQSGLDQYEA